MGEPLMLKRVQGPGLDAYAKRFRRGETRVAAAVGNLIVDVVKIRAFGPTGKDSRGRPYPPGVDNIRTGATRDGFRVIAVRRLSRWTETRQGVTGPAAAYSDKVQRRLPWQAPTPADRRKVASQSAEAVRKALGLGR